MGFMDDVSFFDIFIEIHLFKQRNKMEALLLRNKRELVLLWIYNC